jgi:ABC-type sugar transport system permease subunit
MLLTLLLPTVQTLVTSLQKVTITRPSVFVGFDNYGHVLGEPVFWKALAFTVSLAIVPLLVAVVVGPLLALALDRAGTWPRRAGRVVLSLAVITFSPMAVVAAWSRGTMPDASGLATLTQGLREPETAPVAMHLLIAAATFGVVCALAVMAFLPALRGGTVTVAMLTVGGLLVLTMIAVGLQAFSIVTAMTRGGPNGATQTLGLVQYTYAFVVFQLGEGATVATVVGVILGLLGLAAVYLAVSNGLRLTVTPRDTRVPTPEGAYAPGTGAAHAPSPGPAQAPSQAPFPGPAQAPSPGPGSVPPPASATGRPGGGMAVLGWIALGLFVVIAGLLTWPWLSALLQPSAPGPGDTFATQVNTWVPALIGAVVSVGVAYLGALGIGGLRPLGRHSEWLLLVFAPWLFVGTGPLSIADWQIARNLGLIDAFPALIQPLLVSVPALFVLTLLCKGLAERTDRDFVSGVLLPSLPMAGILAGAVTLVNGHDLLWPLLVAQDPGLATAPVAQFVALGQYSASAPDAGLTTPLVVVAVALVAVVAAQLLYLDRLAITTGDSRKL